MLLKYIQENRKRLDKELIDLNQRKYFSAALYVNADMITQSIVQYAKGKLIDVGCGEMPLKKTAMGVVEQYDTFDIEERVKGVSFVGSILDMNMIKNGSYDTVLCFSVLEHIRDPFRALDELARILKPGGVLIMTVPHLFRLHEEPHDYFRFTHYALQFMLKERNFDIIQLDRCGTLLSFLAHQWSTVFVCLFWRIPLLKQIIFFLNKWLFVIPLATLDRILSPKSKLPLGYLVIARKK